MIESVMMSGDRRRVRDDDGDDDRRSGHLFKNLGAPIAADPWMPEARAVPEFVLARVCLAERADYGGRLSEVDLARLAQMAADLAETNAALMKRARERDAAKAKTAMIRAALPAPAPKGMAKRACLQCEAVFITDRSVRKFCTPLCGRRWHQRARCQPAGEAAHVPAAQNHPAKTDAQAGRPATGNDIPDWAARLRDRAAAYRAMFQQAG